MAGKNKGKEGQITQVFVEESRVVIDGVNKSFKHLKSRQSGAKGQRLEYFAPVAAANVMLLCPKCSKATRVGHKILENKNKVRVCKKCKEVI